MEPSKYALPANLWPIASALLLIACAAEQPPPGGPADTQGPRILQVLPVNEMVRVPVGTQFEILFDELVDPISVPGSVTILPPISFTTRVRGRRIIIRPDEPLLGNQAYVLTLGRGIRDYQRNSLESAQQLVFSTGESIPVGRISGRVWGTQPDDGVWVGLFHLSGELDDPLQSQALADDGSFDFRYLPDGSYRVVAVSGGLADFPQGLRVRSYAMPDFDWVDVASDTARLAMELSPPLVQPQIQSAEWVTAEYVLITFDMPFGPSFLPDGLLQTTSPGVYGYLPPLMDADTVNIALGEATGRLGGRYNIEPVTLRTSAIVDTLPPKYNGGNQVWLTPIDPPLAGFPRAASGRLLFAEPIRLAEDFRLRLTGKDSLSLPAEAVTPVEISFTIMEPGLVDKVAFLGAQLHDYSGNALADSLLTVRLGYRPPQPAGQIRGTLAGISGRVIIEARSQGTGDMVRWTATDSSSYLLEDVPPGLYLIFAHLQVGDRPMPYYSGRWEPFSAAAPFAHYPDIIEVRPRWEVDGVDINFGVVTDSLLNSQPEPSFQ